MKVRYLMLGSVLMLWCHIIWLVVLVGSLETHRALRVLLKNKCRSD